MCCVGSLQLDILCNRTILLLPFIYNHLYSTYLGNLIFSLYTVYVPAYRRTLLLCTRPFSTYFKHKTLCQIVIMIRMSVKYS